MKRRTVIENIDWYLLAAVILLCVLGFLNLYSATSAKASMTIMENQLLAFAVGILLMVLVLFFDYSTFGRYSYLIYFVAIIFLILVIFKGRTIQGSRRWLSLGFVSFQVSDLMKPAFVIVLAKWYSTSKVVGAYSLRDLFVPFILLMIPCALILKQPDLGTALLILFVAFTIIFFGKLQFKSIGILVLIAITVIPLTWKFALKSYQKKRVVAFIDPMSSPKGAGYNVIQSMIAVGSGKFWGKGYKNGTQSALHFLPEHHTDFIFSAWAEEHGFFGSVLLLIIYLFIFLRIIRVASMAKNKFGLLLAIGGGAIFFWYFFINVNMVIGLMPVVGIPLPFFSYGGTAMVVNFVILGMIQNVYARRFVY